MNIGFNALGLKSKTGGVETYIYNMVKTILLNDSNNNYFLFVGKNTELIFKDLKFKNLKIITLPINTNNSILRILAENTLLNLFCIIHHLKLVHHFCNYIPRIFFTKSVVTIHDLGGFFYHEKYPEYNDMHNYYKYMKRELAYTLKKANQIIAISNFTKSEIMKYYPNTSENKIKVIGQSLDTRKTKNTNTTKTIQDLDINKPYLLSISVIRPHKNMEFLIKVFNILKQKYNIPHQLVIAGGIQLKTNSFIDAIKLSPFKDDIKYLGYIENDIMPILYKNADCFIFPSLYEGFGIPLLEAMEYEIPIASSNAASLPEVGGDSCIYFNPYDSNETSEMIYKLLSDSFLKTVLLKKQQEQLNVFCWKNIAKYILNIYNGN